MVEAARLQRQMMELIRAFGLLDVERTPCGEPMSASAAHALAELEATDGLPQRDLASRLRLEKSTVSRLVSDLEGRGWLTRQRDGADGRVVRLRLTEHGRRVAGRVATARAALFGALAERIPAEEHDAVARALGVLVHAVEQGRGRQAGAGRVANPDQES